MDTPLSAAEYWRRPDVVESFTRSTTRPLEYEVDLIESALALASIGGVRRIHVIGVGAGRELPVVRSAAPNAKIHAWDISETMVETCRRVVGDRGWSDVHVGTSDVTDLRDEDPADAVVAINAVLSYLITPEDRRRAASAMAGLLRPGGSIAVVVQQRNGRPDWALWFWVRALASRFGLVPGSRGDRRNSRDGHSLLVHHYTPGELRAMLTAAGFAEVSIRSLRRWGRAESRPVRWRSPNPLLATAVLGPAPTVERST